MCDYSVGVVHFSISLLPAHTQSSWNGTDTCSFVHHPFLKVTYQWSQSWRCWLTLIIFDLTGPVSRHFLKLPTSAFMVSPLRASNSHIPPLFSFTAFFSSVCFSLKCWCPQVPAQDPIPPERWWLHIHSSRASLAFSAVCWQSQLARLKDIAESAYLELSLSSWSCLSVSLQHGFPKYLLRATRRDITCKNLDVGRDGLGRLFFPERRVLSPPSMSRLPLLFSHSIAIASELVLPLVFPLYFPLHSVQNCQKTLLRLALVVMLVAVLCPWV